MLLFNESNMLDAERLSRIARATVQNSGRLGFSADSTDLMGLAPNKRLLVSECGEKDLAVVIGDESDKRGFVIKQSRSRSGSSRTTSWPRWFSRCAAASERTSKD